MAASGSYAGALSAYARAMRCPVLTEPGRCRHADRGTMYPPKSVENTAISVQCVPESDLRYEFRRNAAAATTTRNTAFDFAVRCVVLTQQGSPICGIEHTPIRAIGDVRVQSKPVKGFALEDYTPAIPGQYQHTRVR
eukprot:964763-Rhodomonas_salina.2